MRNDITVAVVGDEGAAPAADRLLATPVDLSVTAADGVAAALSLLGEVDAVVTAATLPDGDAVELVERVRERAPELPVVVLADDVGTVAAATEAGATDCRRPDGAAAWELLAERLADAVAVDRVERLATRRDRDDAQLRPLRELALKGAAVDAASVGMVIADATRPDDPIVYANEGFERLTGYDAEAVEGRNCRFLQGEATDPEAVAELREAVEEGRHAVVELVNYRADGTPWWNRVELTPVRDATGEVVEVIGFQQDVTERKDRERALTELHGATRRLLEVDEPAAVARLVTAAAGDVLDLPVSGVRLAVDGELVPTAIAPERRDVLGTPPTYDLGGTSPAAVAYRRGETVSLSSLSVDDDVDRSALGDAVYVPLGEHGVLGVGALAGERLSPTDRTLVETLAANAEAALDRLAEHERVREQEAALAVERDRHAALFEDAGDPLVYCTFDGDVPIVEAVNPAFEDVFGWDADAVVGADLDALVVPEDDRAEARRISRESRAGVGKDQEVTRLTADGPREFLLRTVPVEAGAEPAAYAMYIDVTERKTREQRLTVLNRVLRHNLRNDMNVVLGSAEEVDDAVDDPAVAGHVDTIRRTGRRLLERSAQARVVEDSLSGAVRETTPVDVAAVARRAADRVAEREPAVTVRTDLPEQAAVAGCDQLPTAVSELLANAVDHGGDEPTVEVRVEPVDGGGRVALSVTDDGPGIPPEEQAVLQRGFETQLEHSSGLGLWLVRWLVEGVGGDLRFETPAGGGTRVVATLPAADAARAGGTGDQGVPGRATSEDRDD